MNNVEKYEHLYYVGIITTDTNAVLKKQFDKWFDNWEYKEVLDKKIEYFDTLIKLGGNKK